MIAHEPTHPRKNELMTSMTDVTTAAQASDEQIAQWSPFVLDEVHIPNGNEIGYSFCVENGAEVAARINAACSRVITAAKQQPAPAAEQEINYRLLHQEATGLLSDLKEIEVHCPCGARPESLDTHSHVLGCPVEQALRRAERICLTANISKDAAPSPAQEKPIEKL